MVNYGEQRMGREFGRHPAEMLKARLDKQSGKINQTVEAEYGLENLLNVDATLDPNGYRDIFGETEIRADAESVRELELEFSSARNSKVQAFYRDTHGSQNEDEIIAQWRENKSREKNGQMEMAITALFSQKLGNEFLVVRTAPYDDYKNGVDNLILDRVTGEVVGAFDEVHEGGGGRRTEEKKVKIQKIAKRGGSKIRYGLRLENGKLTRSSLEGVPVFYLGLESADLAELVKGLNEGYSGITDKIFDKLLTSLEDQQIELKKSATTSNLRARIDSFGRSLARIKK